MNYFTIAYDTVTAPYTLKSEYMESGLKLGIADPEYLLCISFPFQPIKKPHCDGTDFDDCTYRIPH